MYTKDRSVVEIPGNTLNLLTSHDGGPFSGYDFTPYRCVRTIQGERLPNYSRKIKQRSDATTPLTAIYDSVKVKAMNISIRGNDGSDVVIKGTTSIAPSNFSVPDDSSFISSDMDIAAAQALSALNSYVQKRQSPFSAQIFAGELRETLQFIRHPLKTSTELLRSSVNTAHQIKKKGITLSSTDKRRHELSKALASEGLELRFALLPLVDDISNILKILSEEPQSVDRYRFYGEHNVRSGDTPSVTATALVNFRNVQYTNTKYQYIIRVGFVSQLLQHVEGLQGYLKASFEDVTQILPTIWELTPYSFLIDYFVNIGDIISAPLNINTFASYVCASKVQTVEAKYVYVTADAKPGVFIDYPSLVIRAEADSGIIATHRRVDRATLTSTVPPLVFQLPGSDIKLANISALLTKLL